MRDDRTVIVELKPRPLLLIGGFLMGCVALWMGVTGSLIGSPFGIPAEVARWIVFGGGVVFAVAMPLLLISNVVQDWAVLVGSDAGLQVVYPLGLHRFMARSRLEGELTGVSLLVVKETQSKRMPITYLRITAPEGTLEFSFSSKAANPDFRERFARWVAQR